MSETLIKIQHLTKTFGVNEGAVHALKDINLEIRQGEIFDIIDLSGAGKSTLARCINLLEIVGLRDKANAYPSQMSGGQKQRVAIAVINSNYAMEAGFTP